MKKMSILAIAVSTACVASMHANEAHAWFGRGGRSCGSSGGYSTHSSGGSFGGLFSRRHQSGYGDSCNSCDTQSTSYGSCGGTHGMIYESYDSNNGSQSGPDAPPPAPRDPNSGNTDQAGQGGSASVAPTPAVAVDRRQPVVVASNRRLGSVFR
jgi:hypothetical protein